jgi:hypothetical protein
MIHTAVTWPRFAYAFVCGSIDHAGMGRRGLSLSNAPINTQLTDTIPMLNPVMGGGYRTCAENSGRVANDRWTLNLDFIAKVSPASSAARVELEYLESSIGDIAGILPTESEPQ